MDKMNVALRGCKAAALAAVFALALAVSALLAAPASLAHAAEPGDAAIVPVEVNGVSQVKVVALDGALEPEQDIFEIDHTGEIRIPFGDGSKLESRYEVSQIIDGSDTVWDETVWLVQVYAEPNPAGGLNTAVVASKEGSEYKPGKISFENRPEVPDKGGSVPCIVDPPLKKLVVGDTPANAGTFHFAMKAVSNTAGYEVADMPMPEGSERGVKRRTIQGPGEYEFGNFEIVKAGTYVYNMVEEEGPDSNYTYDTVRYTITFIVTDEGGRLVPTVEIVDQDGKRVNACEFTNVYTDPTKPAPTPLTPSGTPTSSTTPGTKSLITRTGDDILPIAGVLGIVALAAAGAVAISRRHSHHR
jgi:pilin isopeptide linkage protein